MKRAGEVLEGAGGIPPAPEPEPSSTLRPPPTREELVLLENRRRIDQLSRRVGELEQTVRGLKEAVRRAARAFNGSDA